ncbi:hypothetical protein EHQ75_09960 [Leptospira levettii]|uniref:hypothetical protein n=1 Tax=Leptospira levettii TaxID=2023178 RepID=UPI001082FA46|nr:hypothetical protein [Leptospira levettii]TGM39324.1 hypothetical protein EHQ75_09960 [Leptospira levettii]
MSDTLFSFGQVSGQDVALTYLKSFLKDRSKIPGSIIFHGPDGVGKWLAAERFARQILCLEGTSCGICDSCRQFMRGVHPDYIQFPRRKNIAIGKEKDPEEFTIRWLLSARIPYKPHTSDYRIVLFPEANRINNEAETTLLKTLEEPPPHTKFILIVNDLHNLKQTIVSRSVCIPFHYLPQEEIKKIRKNEIAESKLYYGGSLNPFEIADEFLEEWHENVREHCHDSILLFKLENWVRDQLGEFRSNKEGLTGIDFLEMICLLLLYEYRQKNFEANTNRIEAILDFKLKLHYEIPALEYVLLSQLFLRLAT